MYVIFEILKKKLPSSERIMVCKICDIFDSDIHKSSFAWDAFQGACFVDLSNKNAFVYVYESLVVFFFQ